MTREKTKRHILLAAVTAIEKHGIQNITTRVIAEEAGVNNAALHYYFGTKEQLLEEALAMTLDHMMQDTSEILDGAGSARQRLERTFNYLIDGMLRYPNIIRAHIQGPLMEGNTNSPFLNMLSVWLETAYMGIGSNTSSANRSSVQIALQSALSTILVAGLMPAISGSSAMFDLREPSTRSTFLDFTINTILAQESIE